MFSPKLFSSPFSCGAFHPADMPCNSIKNSMEILIGIQWNRIFHELSGGFSLRCRPPSHGCQCALPAQTTDSLHTSSNLKLYIMENGTAPHTPTDSTDTPASPDSLEVLKGKKKELDRLLVEIQNLELQNLKSSKLSPLREKPSPRPEDEVYRRLMLVEKELKERDSQIERLLYEKRSLAEIVRQQEETILNMTSELQEVKQKNLKLSHALQLKTEESKMLFSESQQSYHTAVGQQQSLIKRLDEEAKEKGRDKASKELYYHVLFLENELKDRDRVLKELKEENNTFAKLLKQCDEDYTALHNQLTEKVSSEVGTGQNVIVLENRIIELENTVRDVQQENKMLLNIQKAKTEAIQQLTEEVTRRGATEEYVEDLKRQLQAKEKEIKDYAEENKQLIRITREKERQIDHLKQQDVGIPFHLWHQERQLLQVN